MSDSTHRQPHLFCYRGDSMWPSFQDGDLLVVHPVSAASLRPGDCIVYRQRDTSIPSVHRVVAVKPAIRTRGDARCEEDNDSPDPERIVGVVVQRIRFGRSRPVARGPLGVWSGRFFRYAGKIDPADRGKGGRLARLLLTLVCPLSSVIVRRWGRICIFADASGARVAYLMVGGYVLGAFSEAGDHWEIPWPHRLWIVPDLPRPVF